MGLLLSLSSWAMADPMPAAVSQYRLSGPYAHGQLSIFLIHGESQADLRLQTLQEGISSGAVVVHETGTVNQLVIENKSRVSVFIQSGDVVKGGKQDRTFPHDLVIAPGGKISVDAFCVEQGRWSQRSGESAAAFNGSSKALASKELKFAARYLNQQQAVWQNVAQLQQRLANQLDTQVQSARSETSLQLTLENKDLEKKVQEYDSAISRAVANSLGEDDVIGFVFAVQGEVNAAEVYASHDMFAKLWPKQLEAAIIESLAAPVDPNAEAKELTKDDVLAVLADAHKAASKPQSPESFARHTVTTLQESQDNVLFESRLPGEDGQWLHRTYVTKDPRIASLILEAAAGANNPAQQLEGLRRQMQQQIENLPPDQRQRIEEAQQQLEQLEQSLQNAVPQQQAIPQIPNAPPIPNLPAIPRQRN
jgi:hypothetical protein